MQKTQQPALLKFQCELLAANWRQLALPLHLRLLEVVHHARGQVIECRQFFLHGELNLSRNNNPNACWLGPPRKRVWYPCRQWLARNLLAPLQVFYVHLLRNFPNRGDTLISVSHRVRVQQNLLWARNQKKTQQVQANLVFHLLKRATTLIGQVEVIPDFIRMGDLDIYFY